MVFNMKRLLALLLVGQVFVAQAGMRDWVRLVEQRPVVAAKALALVPLGLGALYFGGYAVNCGLEACEAYTDHKIQLARNINAPQYDHRTDMVQKGFESFASAVLAAACVKLARICYQSLKNDIIANI